MITGSCCYFLQSHLNPITSPYTSCSLLRNGGRIIKRITAPAPAPSITCLKSRCLMKDGIGISKRKVILFVGVSILLPLLLQLMIKAKVSDTLAAGQRYLLCKKKFMPLLSEEAKMKKTVGMQISQGVATPNALQSLGNGLGIIGSTVLGSFYASARNEMDASEVTIESMRMEINENQASIAFLKKNFDLQIQNEREDRNKQAKMECEMNLSFTKKLKMEDIMITGIGQELQKEKRMVEDLNVQIQNLQIILLDNTETKKDLEEKLKEKSKSIEVLEERIAILSWEIKEKEVDLHNLSYVVSPRESDLKEMKFSNEHVKYELAGLNSEVRRLNEELLRSEREIELKDAANESLNSLVSSLLVEREHSSRRIDAILKDNNVHRSSFRERSAADAQLLDEKDLEIQRLKEGMDSISRELTRIEPQLIILTQERDGNREMLDSELKIVKNLKHGIGIAERILENSKKEVSDMTDQLHQSEKLYSDLETELTKVQSEFSATKKTLEKSLDNEKQSLEDLASKLKSANEILKKSQDDLKIKSNQLADTVEIRNSLNEIIKEYAKIEKRSSDLKEGKEAVESLNREKRTLEIQILENRESIRFLETDLKEVTRSLNKMNGKAMMLIKDIEISNILRSKLELEKEKFFKSLDDLQEVYREAQDNIEDVQRILIKLAKEKENLEKRSKKLEEELASVKEEIIHLTSLMNSSPSPSPKAHSGRQRRNSSDEN